MVSESREFIDPGSGHPIVVRTISDIDTGVTWVWAKDGEIETLLLQTSDAREARKLVELLHKTVPALSGAEIHHYDSPEGAWIEVGVRFEPHLGLWLCWEQGDAARKPLYAGSDEKAARDLYERLKAGYIERRKQETAA